ncbi:HU domain-containing protein [Cellulophaga tyrosinoxydans]|uniref:Sporulation related domain-containing protein n=1 Tax=Cellulophaga tyrosinoxydans TaxID=504486 RepID=A0A1W1YRL7_9FLAO|nr:SPOR domain-containing protein [Cellulophaga tyrosinoxydans]SMC38855.1 Sporulation related domain-containing protein [Cellulophaga tyrosinoxydans]
MRLEHYIEELLYRYNCVIVPEFGAFLTQSKAAFIKEETHTFYPPSKVVSFNEQLVSNDGLLVSYVAEAEKTTYEDMLQRLSVIGKNWKKQLSNGERLVIGTIGKLWLNTEGKILFEPSGQVNYLTSSFGLSSCISGKITREILKTEVEKLEEEIPFIITPEQREKKEFRPYLKYAAVVFLSLAMGLSGYKFYQQNTTTDQLVQQDAQKQVSKHIEEATFFDTTPLELPALNLNASVVAKEPKTMYHIIAGAFKVKENADKKIEQLVAKGFNASYIGVNKFGFHVVSFESFTEADKALNYLRTIKRTESNDAWLFQE